MLTCDLRETRIVPAKTRNSTSACVQLRIVHKSALGVVVLDQAVVERFRTDQEFGGQSYGFDNAIQRFLGFEDQLAGVNRIFSASTRHDPFLQTWISWRQCC